MRLSECWGGIRLLGSKVKRQERKNSWENISQERHRMYIPHMQMMAIHNQMAEERMERREEREPGRVSRVIRLNIHIVTRFLMGMVHKIQLSSKPATGGELGEVEDCCEVECRAA